MRTIEYAKRVTKNVRPSWSHVVASTKQYEFGYIDRDGDARYVPFYDDAGLQISKRHCYPLYVISHEFGPCRIVHAMSEDTAYNVHLDESETIPVSELAEAYGIADKLENHLLKKKGNKDGGHMIDFCRRWATFYFDLLVAQEKYPDLEEGYQMQSNSTGTGIVNVGFYEHIEQVSIEKIAVRRKVVSVVDKFCRKAGL